MEKLKYKRTPKTFVLIIGIKRSQHRTVSLPVLWTFFNNYNEFGFGRDVELHRAGSLHILIVFVFGAWWRHCSRFRNKPITTSNTNELYAQLKTHRNNCLLHFYYQHLQFSPHKHCDFEFDWKSFRWLWFPYNFWRWIR